MSLSLVTWITRQVYSISGRAIASLGEPKEALLPLPAHLRGRAPRPRGKGRIIPLTRGAIDCSFPNFVDAADPIAHWKVIPNDRRLESLAGSASRKNHDLL